MPGGRVLGGRGRARRELLLSAMGGWVTQIVTGMRFAPLVLEAPMPGARLFFASQAGTARLLLAVLDTSEQFTVVTVLT